MFPLMPSLHPKLSVYHHPPNTSRPPSVPAPKCPGPQVSRSPSVPAPKCPGPQVSRSPSVPVPKCPGPQVSWPPSVPVPKCPGPQVSRTPTVPAPRVFQKITMSSSIGTPPPLRSITPTRAPNHPTPSPLTRHSL